MPISGRFLFLPAATLSDLATQYTACLRAIAVAGASYSIGGRTFTRANLSEVADILADLTYAQQVNSGSHSQITYAKLDQ